MSKRKIKKSIKYSFIKILTGSDLSVRKLAYMQVDSNINGPVVWLTGCVHGDEVGGIVIIQEIFKRLKKSPLIKGSLHAFPLMNPIGFELVTRGISLSEEDLNRSFPGNASGTLAERMASKIFAAIMKSKPTFVLDMHNDWINSIPHILIDPFPGQKHKLAYSNTKLLASKMGFPIINEKEEAEESEELKKSLSGSLLARDIPALTLEIGGASIVSSIIREEEIQDGVKAIWDVLTYLGMVNPIIQDYNYEFPQQIKNKILKYSHQPVCSTSGIIRYLVKPGQLVKKDEAVARIYNVFGKLQETLVASNNGLVLSHYDYSIAYPGAEIIAFGLF